MSFLSWLFGTGIAGAISADLVKKYLGIKSRHLNEKEREILERLWNFWLTLNAEKIQTEDGEDKIVRLSIIKENDDKKTTFNSKSLFNLYQDIFYIKTEITTSDGKIWDNSMKVFIKELKQYGLDFSQEYESLKRIKDIVI
jgi:hypothetical protein